MVNLQKRILVIDDDPDVCILWKNVLKALGEEAPILVSDGNELKTMSIDYASIKFAIVDFKFEGSEFCGVEIIEYLRQKNIEKIYLSTGYADDDEVCRKARQQGITDIIAKPVSLEKVKKILGKK